MLSRVTFLQSWLPQYRVLLVLCGETTYDLFWEYVAYAAWLEQHHGTVSMVKALKGAYAHGKAVSAGQTGLKCETAGIWLKLDSNGFPRKLRLISRSVEKGGPLNLGLGTLGLVNLIFSAPSKDISTVTDASTATWGGGDKVSYLQKWKHSVEKLITPSDKIRWDGYHVSLKAGPMSPSAVLSSGLEAVGLALSPGNLFNFHKYAAIVGANDLSLRLNSFQSWVARFDHKAKYPKVWMLAKLAYLADKAGKTRVVYILNWWMQDLLRPLHDAMMEWLRKQPQDGTWDQRSAVQTIKSWTKEGKPLWSFDLTAATDRWPKDHQKVVVQRFAGADVADMWDWALGMPPHASPGQMVSYSVGQPMGAYASWSALAMTHHLVIRHAADLAGVTHNCYVVLGDDVVIADDKVAKNYLTIMEDLGVCISKAKSLLAERQRSGSSAEFAKQVIRDGRNLTPVSPLLITQIFGHHQWWMAYDLVNEVVDRLGYGLLRHGQSIWIPTPVALVLNILGKDVRDKVLVMITDPTATQCVITDVKEPPIGSSYKLYPDPWAGVQLHEILLQRLEVVMNMFQTKLQGLMALRDSLTGAGGFKPAGYLTEIPSHPIWAVIDDLEKAIKDACRTIANGEQPSGMTRIMTDVDYIINVVQKGESHRQWKDRKSLRRKVYSSVSLSAHKLCSRLDSSTEMDYSDW